MPSFRRRGQAIGRTVGRGKPFERFLAVVMDGVAKVQLGHLVMPVRDNVAAAQANGNLPVLACAA